MKEIENFTIDGINFVSQEYDFDHGWPLFFRLLKISGKSLLTFLFEGMDGLIKEFISGDLSQKDAANLSVSQLISKIDRSKIVDAFEAFFEKIEPDHIIVLTNAILSKTWIIDSENKRNDINPNIHFKGKYGLVIKVLRAVLLLQYSSSFQELLSGLTEQNKSVPKQVSSKVVAR